MSKKKQYDMLNAAGMIKHDWEKFPRPNYDNSIGRTLSLEAFKRVHGAHWQTVAHRMRTWYAAKFKQAAKDRDQVTAYRMQDQHNNMLAMIQAG